jgi:hypothetical protein
MSMAEDAPKRATDVQHTDTTPHDLQHQIDLIRPMRLCRMMEPVGGEHSAVRKLALACMRHRFPEHSHMLTRRRLGDLLLGPELAQLVCRSMPQTSPRIACHSLFARHECCEQYTPNNTYPL